MLRGHVASRIKVRNSRVLISLLFLPLIFMTGGCFDSYNVTELETERDVIINSIDRYNNESEKIQVRIDALEKSAAATKEVQKAIDAAVIDKRTKEEEIEEFEPKLRAVMSMLKACQGAFKIKIDLKPGTKFESIKLNNGKELKGVVFKGYADEAIKFSHSGGIGTFPIDQMPDMISVHMIMPPGKPLTAVDPVAILARKPDSLKTSDQIKKAKSEAYAAKRAAADLAYEERAAKEAADRKRMAAEKEAKYQAEKKKKNAWMIQMDALQAELRKREAAFASARGAFLAKEAELNNAKIRVAKADREKTLGGYRNKLAPLQQKVTEIQEQIRALQARP